MRPTAFARILLVFQAILVGLAEALFFAVRRENLFAALRPELPGGMILAVGGAAALVAAVAVFGLYRFVPAYARAVEPAVEVLRRWPRGYLWAAALFAPLGEELLFRGALQPLVGLFWASALFGLLHTGFRREYWAYGVTAGALGLLLGLTYWFLGELWAPIVAHTLYNALVMAALPLFSGPTSG